MQRVGSIPLIPIPLGEPWPGVLSFVLILFTGTLAGVSDATRGAMAICVVAGLVMGFGWIDIYPGWWFIAMVIAVGGHLRRHGLRL